MIDIYIGYDENETEAFFVLAYSIMVNASVPIRIVPLKENLFKDFYSRQRHPLQSTAFSFTRFLVPYLNGFKGWAIFMDCDFLCLKDIAGLWALRDPGASLMCVQHNHIPKHQTKFLGQPQTKYRRKNWSSLMMFNCAECSNLTPEYVEEVSGLDLHQMTWLTDHKIGSLPQAWNYLVDVCSGLEEHEIAMLHYTNGGPWFRGYRHCTFAQWWLSYRDKLRGRDNADIQYD